MSEDPRDRIDTPQIIFEDNQLLILNKPSGWVVNDANTVKHNLIIQNWIKKNIKSEISNLAEFRSGIVHRLDKETSGVLIVAKTKLAFAKLQKQFKDRIVKKTYIALLHGRLIPEEGEIDAPVGRLPWRKDRFGVLAGGRESRTNYKVQKYLLDDEDNEYTLSEFYPHTGRTHQIRIHAKHLHHPVVADEFYAGRKRSRQSRKWCPRLFLHASKIDFVHPKTNKRVNYEAELHSDLKQALSLLH